MVNSLSQRPAPAPFASLGRRLPAWLRDPIWLRRFALASVVVNVGIVVTGGAVRLSDSGLGCPTWPRCVGNSLVPHDRLGLNGAIEFTNRTLTFVVGLTLLATFLLAAVQRRHAKLALIALLGIPAQAVLGGVVVLSDLNPWLVALHFLLSAAIIAVTLLVWWRVSERSVGSQAPTPVALVWLTRGLVAATAVVLMAGTVVTGAGPHAGDLKDGRVHRIDAPIAGLAQLHADLVMILIGLTIGAVVAGQLASLRPLRDAAVLLFAVELAQGGIGYAQYFLHVPPVLVGLHMFGACLVWVAALRVALLVGALGPRPAGVALRTAG
jgi:cytochrome c oxidase assembly protein subunit 15